MLSGPMKICFPKLYFIEDYQYEYTLLGCITLSDRFIEEVNDKLSADMSSLRSRSRNNCTRTNYNK